MLYSFLVSGSPIPQPRPRVTKFGVFVPKKHPVHDYKQAIKYHAGPAKPKGWKLDGPLEIDILFVLSRARGRGGFAKDVYLPDSRFLATRVPDLDNLVKAVFDALKGVAWVDDCQVIRGNYTKIYAACDEDPHTLIDIRPCTFQNPMLRI